ASSGAAKKKRRVPSKAKASWLNTGMRNFPGIKILRETQPWEFGRKAEWNGLCARQSKQPAGVYHTPCLTGGPVLLRIGKHEGKGEAVVAFAANGLDFRGADASFGRKALVEAADALDVGVFACGVDYAAIADYVVRDNQASGPGELQSPIEIFGHGVLVGVDEDEVERAARFRGDLWKRIQRRA